MTEALAPPFLVASLVLCAAGVFKLRSPQVAAGVLGTLGLPGGPGLVRAMAAGEIVLGAACAIDPGRPTAAVLAGAYMAFAAVSAALAGRRVSCGCFGDSDTPVSRVHVVTNLGLGMVAAAGATAPPRGIGWLLERPAGMAAALALGVAGAAYAVVLLYTQLPAAWAAWSGE